MASCLHPLSFWLHFVFLLQGSRSSHRHLCVPVWHGHNPGGVSEIRRLFEKGPWEPGLMVMMVLRCERRSV